MDPHRRSNSANPTRPAPLPEPARGCSPFLLQSVWALAPSALAAAWVVLRTALEDAPLRRELDGYQEYARRVRFRLVPGLW